MVGRHAVDPRFLRFLRCLRRPRFPSFLPISEPPQPKARRESQFPLRLPPHRAPHDYATATPDSVKDAATAIAAVIALVGGSLLGVVLNDAVDAVLAIFWPPVVGVEEKELLLARQGPANGHHMRTRLRAALEEQAEEDMAEPAFRLTDLPFALVGGLFQAVGRVLKELVDGLTRVLALVLVVFASAGSFLRAFGATLVALVVRPFSRLMIGREAPRAAQVQVVQVPRIAVNPPQLFGQGFLATRNGKMHQLADSEEFFRAVAEHLQVPACADLALDMYAVALGLNAEWRGLTAGTVKVYVLCEAVRQLTQDVPLEQVVDAAVMIAPATGPAVADALLQQVHWVLFSHRPFDDTGHTIPEDVRIIGRRVGWLPERMVRVAHASRIATALGVAGRQREIVAAACAIVGDIPVEEIVDRHRYNRRAVENAVTQMTELGVVGLLGPEAS